MISVLLGRLHGKDEKWKLICGPEVPHSKQVQVRAEMAGTHPVNEKYSTVILCRTDADSYIKSKLQFVNAKQHAQNGEDIKKSNAELAAMQDKSADRQKKMEADIAAEKKAKHDAEVARINVENDKARAIVTPSKIKV